jgi:hypothetical protein
MKDVHRVSARDVATFENNDNATMKQQPIRNLMSFSSNGDDEHRAVAAMCAVTNQWIEQGWEMVDERPTEAWWVWPECAARGRELNKTHLLVPE